METTIISKLKKGDYFKKVNSKGELSKKVYIYDGYCRMTRKYAYSSFDDISSGFYAKKDMVVSTDFIF